MAKTEKTMIKSNVVKRLINTYTDDIVTDDNDNLDYDETVYNFAKSIVNDMEESQQKSVFGKTFSSYDECYDHLNNNIPSLRQELEIFIN